MGSELKLDEDPEEGSLGLNCGLMTAVGGGRGLPTRVEVGAPTYLTKFFPNTT